MKNKKNAFIFIMKASGIIFLILLEILFIIYSVDMGKYLFKTLIDKKRDWELFSIIYGLNYLLALYLLTVPRAIYETVRVGESKS